MHILMAGDIVGGPGRRIFAEVVARLKEQGLADVVVANAENSAGGRGLTGVLAEELFAAGADVLTMGDHTWDQREFAAYLETEKRVVRPANFPPGCPGRGWTSVETSLGKISVVNIVGRVFMPAQDCPFRTMDAILEKRGELGDIVLVDVHAEATAEKIVLGRYLDGRVTALVGSHTHVQTSDEGLLPDGTAYITDLGMTGAKDSTLGRDLESVTQMFLTGMPCRFKVAKNNVVLEGVVIDVDRESGRARSIRRIREAPANDAQ